ncbi:Zinc finger protein 609 [Acipenser ruthenus]|uniref:Zinc finger protein 609 n=1 Tax=Acipenser ruthenus TaxID=7906 RepID=A0A662YNM4_ACIRT|nr:Zinc finger protein 609 [Acipenser ruthenus]
MSLSSGTAGGKGVDSNAVDTYDSGDEWDIGVGNLIIDLDADLEKDQQKLEMSGAKEGGGMAAPTSAVAALPDNIKFVSPVPTSQGKESKSKSKRSKNSKDSGKASSGEGGKRDSQVRPLGDSTTSTGTAGSNNPPTSKGTDKSAKASRSAPSGKKESSSGKNKKDKTEGAASSSEKEASVQGLALAARGGQFEAPPSADLAAVEQLGNMAVESSGIAAPLGIKTEPEELNSESRTLKKVKTEKMESPVSTPAPPPLHLLAPVGNNDISSPCEQIMVRTRSVAVNTSDVALATEPECLGPCEPGTSVNLEGIVWQETEDGMLVVNVTWRNKTYVGTLLDCTRHDWAPPRFCESPTSDLEMRNGRGRGKRMRPNSNTPVNENSNSSDTKGSSGGSKTRAGSNSKGRRGSQTSSEHRTPPNSNTEDVKASPSSANKRKSKPASDMEPNSSSEDTKGSKRMRTNSNSSVPPPAMPVPAVKCEPLPPAVDRNCPSPVLIDCPHPNCNKKYKHMNGLKYHQARAHNDEGIKQEMDGDSEYGEDSTLHPEPGSCNGASVSQKGCLSPAQSLTPKGRGFEGHSPSPSPGKFSSKQSSKKKSCDTDQESVGVPIDGSEDGPCLTDEASNDGMDDKKGSDKDKSKKPNSGSAKPDKVQQKSLKSARPIAPAIPPQQLYTFQTATFTTGSPGSSPGLTTTVVQAMPKSPQLKAIQPKPTVMGEPSTVNPSLNSSKDKKKKDKKKKESKDADSPNPSGKGGKPEEGKSPYSESSDPGSKSDGMLNGSSDPHQSRLASIKAEADKIYSFSDNAPSPLIGVASRLDSTGMVQPVAPLHVLTQNGADNSSVKTNSPAYSDISDAGEDGEGKADSVKVKADDQAVREGAKKALFPSQPPSKESPFYSGYEAYYSPNYTNPSPGASNSSTSLAEGQPVKVKKEEEPEPIDTKVKVEPPEERKPEVSMPCQQQQPSVIQQRSNMYMQPLYYNQYAYVPPYGYSDQAYHAHLMASNPAYRQQYEEHQRQRQATEQHRAAEKKSDMAMREREAAMKEEWKQKASIPPTISKAPSLTDLGKPAPTSKPKDSDSEPAKSVIIPKVEDSSSSSSSSSSSKIQSQQAEGLKMKLSEGSHHSKEMSEARSSMESSRQPAVDQAMWYRQEPDSRMWPYVYPNKYPDSQKQEEEQRWKEERERERKGKEERPRPKETAPKEENKESMDPRLAMHPSEDHRSKDPRSTTHMQFTSHLAQHQSYMPYIHGYPYAQGYDPNHPGYRGMPSVMMQNYPGSYLSSGYSFSPYGNKMPGSEEGEKSRSSPTVSSKSSSESKALDILQQHASHYKSKSPTVSDKQAHERERAERERDERPRSSPSQRLMTSHHHLGYPLQYDLPYAAGLSSSAIIASQQASAPSLYPPPRRLKIMADSQDPGEVLSLLSTAGQTESPKEEESQSSLHCRVRVAGPTPCENGKKCYRGSTPDLLSSVPVQTVNKYNTQYHKLFQCLPKEEVLMKVYSCALLRDILLQGRLYISKNWLCFHANLFGKDIKVAIPVVSVLLVKKHKTAGLVPNGLAITTESSQKYLFVSLLSRDSVYDVLRRVCTHLQVNGKKILSIKQYTEEPSALSLLLPHDEFPTPDEFPPVLKWRRKPSTASIASSLPDILGNSTSSLSAVDASFQSDSTTQERSLETEEVVMVEPVPELGQMEYQLLKFFILLHGQQHLLCCLRDLVLEEQING